MRIEDALLFVVFDAAKLAGTKISDLAREAIGVGADIIGIKLPVASRDSSLAEAVSAVCREEDALFIIWDDASLVKRAGADGVHLRSADESIGTARAVAGGDCLVGINTDSLEDAMLAAEVGADYIVHTEGAMCAAVFGQLRGSGLSTLYAGGMTSLDEARQAVGNGVFRICLLIENETDAKADVLAEYSRLFGRVI
jgi:hypothetical protein